MGIIKTLITPAEVIEYLTYRQALIEIWGEYLNTLPEQSLVGHYIQGIVTQKPKVDDAKFLTTINYDIEQWDITGIIHLFADRIIDPTGKITDYYKVLALLSKLKRNELKLFKRKYLFSRQKAISNLSIEPSGFVIQRLNLGFVFINLSKDKLKVLNVLLKNLTQTYKHYKKVEKCIGMVFIKSGSKEFDVGWCLIDLPWEHNKELDDMLNHHFPFRETD